MILVDKKLLTMNAFHKCLSFYIIIITSYSKNIRNFIYYES